MYRDASDRWLAPQVYHAPLHQRHSGFASQVMTSRPTASAARRSVAQKLYRTTAGAQSANACGPGNINHCSSITDALVFAVDAVDLMPRNYSGAQGRTALQRTRRNGRLDIIGAWYWACKSMTNECARLVLFLANQFRTANDETLSNVWLTWQRHSVSVECNGICGDALSKFWNEWRLCIS